MRMVRAGIRPVFGGLVLVHALAHAVFPARGWITPEMQARDYMPFIVYCIAVVGFTIAGLGLFNIRPFVSMMRPAMVLASAYSMIAIVVFGQPDLLWGGAVDLVLFVTGLTGAYRYLPERQRIGHGIWHDLTVSAATTLVLAAAIGVVLWPLQL